MKKWLLFSAIVLIIGISVYYTTTAKRRTKRGDHAVQIVQAQLGTIEDAVETTGEVMPLNRVEIKPPIAGRVEYLKVDEGDRVNAGQILGWMSSTDRAAILDAARAKGENELKHWQDTYKPTPIVAPLAGTIILRNVVVGQTVDAATVIYAMSDKMILKADVDETDIGRIRIGMPAIITLDAYPTQAISGEVFQILHEGVNVSNVITYPVKIEPKNAPPFFRSQMTANIRLISSKKDNVLLVPLSAVSTASSGDKQVMVPGPDGRPVAQTVQVGLESDAGIEIVSGLKEGDKVYLSSKRYVPQQAATSSPLIMGGQRQQGQGSGQRGGR